MKFDGLTQFLPPKMQEVVFGMPFMYVQMCTSLVLEELDGF
jgi:hypothetical protein